MASRRSSSHSSLSGGGGAGGYRRPWQNHMDMYRKVPNDILEGTKRGSILSYVSLVVMVTLIGYETGTCLLTLKLRRRRLFTLFNRNFISTILLFMITFIFECEFNDTVLGRCYGLAVVCFIYIFLSV